MNGSAISILLVEDDEVDIENAQREFKKLSAPVHFTIAKNGIEALDKLHGENGQEKLLPPPQVILLDINLPKMNGIEFLKKLRSEKDFKFTKVFLFTVSYNSQDKIATRDLNVAGYIVKPLEFNDVMRVYWSVIGGVES